MKSIILALGVIALLCGCVSTPPAKRYTVFTPDAILSLGGPLYSDASGVRVRMAEDLRAYNVPLFFHADGSVTPYRALQYYAPLEVALKRALEEVTVFSGKRPEKEKIVVRDYCIVEHPNPSIEGRPAGWEVRVTLQVTSVAHPMPMHRSASIHLEADATPQEIRAAFAQALLDVYNPEPKNPTPTILLKEMI